jgi:hypothetical protein
MRSWLCRCALEHPLFKRSNAATATLWFFCWRRECCLSTGDLEVIYWSVKSTGPKSVAICRTDSGTAGPASLVASCLVESTPITAGSGGSSFLNVEAWTFAIPATHTTYNTMNAITSVSTTTTGSEYDFDYFATAVRKSAGDLEVQKWAYALNPVIK